VTEHEDVCNARLLWKRPSGFRKRSIQCVSILIFVDGALEVLDSK